MNVIADLQIHSKYSRAVSNRMNIEELYRWACIKGAGLIATGDWTHPLWMREIQAKLEETGRGTLILKKEVAAGLVPALATTRVAATVATTRVAATLPTTRVGATNDPEFLLATEISSIYSQGDKTRRVHNLLWVPSLAVAQKITEGLLKRGCNLSADGRPIVGLSSIELAELVFEIDETCLIIPAHAWTPWFAMYGSKSGFDSIDDCFGKYADYIYAIETGLSSDPLMNWRIAELDKRAIVSFSDAHSGPKMGREATVFELGQLSYRCIREAIINRVNDTVKQEPFTNHIVCTYEFYPEEGKYHWDGHRACNYRQTPSETRKNGIICPVCGRGMTVGVEYRVDQIAGRVPVTPVLKTDNCGVVWKHHPDGVHPPYVSIVPLLEILAEASGVSTNAKKVQTMYFNLIEKIGDEFTILLKTPLDQIAHASDQRIATAVGKVRAGDISIDPGYDGVFGSVNVLGGKSHDTIADTSKEQMSLL